MSILAVALVGVALGVAVLACERRWPPRDTQPTTPRHQRRDPHEPLHYGGSPAERWARGELDSDDEDDES